MALVIQTSPMTGSYLPFERPPQPYALWSVIPRGLQSFLIPAEVLDAKPVNDDFLLNMTATLPSNFGYVLDEINFHIAQDRAGDWSNVVTLNLQNFYRAGITESVGLSGVWHQTFPVTSIDVTTRAINVEQPWPRFPMIGTPGTSGIQIVLSAWNANNTVSTAGTHDAFVSFWQFDLEQIRKYPINSPTPVHAR